MDQTLPGFSMRRAVVLSVPSMTLMMSYFLSISVCGMHQTLSGFNMKRAAVLSVHSKTLMVSYFLHFSVWYGPNSVWLQHEKNSGIISAPCDLNDVIFPLYFSVGMDQTLSGFNMKRAVVLSVHSMTLMVSYFLYFSV